MPVPEATVNEDHGPVAGKNDVRFSGQVCPPKGKTEPEPMGYGPDPQLRASVAAPDAAHVPASMFMCNSVGHRMEDQSDHAAGLRRPALAGRAGQVYHIFVSGEQPDRVDKLREWGTLSV